MKYRNKEYIYLKCLTRRTKKLEFIHIWEENHYGTYWAYLYDGRLPMKIGNTIEEVLEMALKFKLLFDYESYWEKIEIIKSRHNIKEIHIGF